MYNRSYKFERQGGSWLERWQREARRFFGKSGPWNPGDREIEEPLLQGVSEHDLSRGRTGP